MQVSGLEAHEMYKNCFIPDSNKSLRSNLSKYAELSGFMQAFDEISLVSNEVYTQTGINQIGQSDYLRLVKNAILVNLSGFLGLRVQQILSKCGNFIYLLIQADDASIEK